jgi:phage virion morphogenesis protein
MTRIRLDTVVAQKSLTQLRQKLGDLQPVMANIGESMVRATDNRFRDERAPDGSAWAPLAAATLKRKQRKGKILKINQETGNLRGTIIYQASGNSVEIGSVLPYSQYPQYGTRRHRARPYLGTSDQDLQAIQEIINRYIAN